MPTTFGAKTDFFGMADADWVHQTSSYTPETQQAQALNAFGDVPCEERYAATTSVEVVYKLQSNGTSGMVSLPTSFKGGGTNTEGTDTYVITGGTLALSNTERPTLTVTGTLMHGEETALPEYDFATRIGEIYADKLASVVGFVLAGETKANSCNVSCTCETVNVLDENGAIAIVDVYQGRLESSLEVVTCEGEQTVTAAAGWALASDVSEEESNEGFLTGSATAYLNMVNGTTTTTTV